MTEQQLTALKDLATRFNSSLEYVDIVHNPFDLPEGWVSVIVNKPEEGVPAHKCNKMLIFAGISPEGNVSS